MSKLSKVVILGKPNKIAEFLIRLSWHAYCKKKVGIRAVPDSLRHKRLVARASQPPRRGVPKDAKTPRKARRVGVYLVVRGGAGRSAGTGGRPNHAEGTFISQRIASSPFLRTYALCARVTFVPNNRSARLVR